MLGNEMHALNRINKNSPVESITRRSSLRITYKRKLRYGLLRSRVKTDPNELVLTGTTFNLSANGVGIECSRGFPPSAKIQAYLYTGERTIRFEGTVKWSYPSQPEKLWRMGIEFNSRKNILNKVYTSTKHVKHFGLD